MKDWRQAQTLLESLEINPGETLSYLSGLGITEKDLDEAKKERDEEKERAGELPP